MFSAFANARGRVHERSGPTSTHARVWMQTSLGVLLALAIAGLCGVQGVAWLHFAGAGVVLGYTADVWMHWIQGSP